MEQSFKSLLMLNRLVIVDDFTVCPHPGDSSHDSWCPATVSAKVFRLTYATLKKNLDSCLCMHGCRRNCTGVITKRETMMQKTLILVLGNGDADPKGEWHDLCSLSFYSPFVCQVFQQQLPTVSLNVTIMLFFFSLYFLFRVCSLLAGAKHQRALPSGRRLCRCHWPEDERISRHVWSHR